MNMVFMLIFAVGLVWVVSVVVALSLCAVAGRSDEAARLLAGDPRLN